MAANPELGLTSFQPPGGQFDRLVGQALSVGTNGTTITPVAMVHHITGTSTGLTTIVAPWEGFTGPIYLVADSVFSWTLGGNIGTLPLTTLQAGRAYAFLYDGTAVKWYPCGG